ncbi:hypothetical protein WJX84_000709 [Apatococcus fuscideae]|uniref:Uncharacterized protein n=1 Tax=Apatococcus fuscideae TaxID=2026836 RepID=A0AAW1TGQ5_9CHLO
MTERRPEPSNPESKTAKPAWVSRTSARACNARESHCKSSNSPRFSACPKQKSGDKSLQDCLNFLQRCVGKPSRYHTADALPSQPLTLSPAGTSSSCAWGTPCMICHRLPQKDGSSPDSSTVELPYCEGIEVVTAAELQHAPAELLRSPSGDTVEDPTLKGTSLEGFPGKFGASATKILMRMRSNASQLATTAKRASDDLLNEFWGRGRDR